MADSEPETPQGLRARVAMLEAEIARLRAQAGDEEHVRPIALKGAEKAAAPGATAPGDDLAALASSEQRLRLILESAVEYAIFTTDLDGKVTTWNEGARRIIGFEESEILGRPGEVIFVPEDRASGAAALEMQRCLANGRAEDERWHLRSDGTRFLARGLLMPLQDNGTPRGFLKILRDRTNERRAEEELQAALDHQQVLVREISHRVKNSLQLVANLLQLQTFGSQDPHVRDALNDAVARVMVVAQIHDRLWRQNDISTVDFAGFVHGLCADLQQTAPNCRLNCETPALSVETRVAVPMGLILNELVTNAFKYGCPERRGRVDVTIRQPAEGTVRLEVRDYGPGLPAGFDPGETGGSLGMRLITGMLRQLEGSMEAGPGNPGARFVVTIPLNGPE